MVRVASDSRSFSAWLSFRSVSSGPSTKVLIYLFIYYFLLRFALRHAGPSLLSLSSYKGNRTQGPDENLCTFDPHSESFVLQMPRP
jgi:hypothetical protein